ncbi:MAG: hypothetical protein FWD55_09015, partial [Propionibacteriaceae bacterium]|nr:hypothetical protein [Propionibacteriaceae bacterium]
MDYLNTIWGVMMTSVRSRTACLALAVTLGTGGLFCAASAHAAGLVPDNSLRACIADRLSQEYDSYAKGTSKYATALEATTQVELDLIGSLGIFACQ